VQPPQTLPFLMFQETAERRLNADLSVTRINKDRYNLATDGVALASLFNSSFVGLCIRQMATKNWQFGCHLRVITGVRPHMSVSA